VRAHGEVDAVRLVLQQLPHLVEAVLADLRVRVAGHARDVLGAVTADPGVLRVRLEELLGWRVIVAVVDRDPGPDLDAVLAAGLDALGQRVNVLHDPGHARDGGRDVPHAAVQQLAAHVGLEGLIVRGVHDLAVIGDHAADGDAVENTVHSVVCGDSHEPVHLAGVVVQVPAVGADGHIEVVQV
jgi:hypothetical protein